MALTSLAGITKRMKYFTNLPIINYSNNYVRNLLTRVKFAEDYKKNAASFYPYVQKESSGSLRYEDIAYDYYDESEDVWILHLFNEVVDPYYDIALSQQDFSNYLTKKYGSLAKAYQTILFYRNNYDQDDSFLSENGFNALTEEVKKYWVPTANFDNKIIGYDRAKEDTTITTNRIITIEFSLIGNTQFVVGERVTQGDSSGFVTFSNTTAINLQHIQGSFLYETIEDPTPYYIYGEDSKANAETVVVNTVFNAFGGTTGSMSPNEEVYFSPVSAFDYENELNEMKRNINILDRRFVPEVHSSLKELFDNGI